MGYIYLQPPTRNISEYHDSNKIDNYVELSKLRIPRVTESESNTMLDKMKIASKTYSEAFKAGEVEEEYCNDKDENGYVKGIELNLSKEIFISLIKQEAYKGYFINWRSKDFILVTFDFTDNVFDSKNVIYPLSKENDAFLIAKIEERYGTALIKALISARDDLYPVDYLLHPHFVLWE